MSEPIKRTPGKWEVHQGVDYIAVLRGDQTTDQGLMVDNMDDAIVVAAVPAMLQVLLDVERFNGSTGGTKALLADLKFRAGQVLANIRDLQRFAAAEAAAGLEA